MEYVVKLNTDEIGIVMEAISELPLKDVLPVYIKLKQQMTEQDLKYADSQRAGTN